MADDVEKSAVTDETDKPDNKEDRIGCSHYARKCILIVSK